MNNNEFFGSDENGNSEEVYFEDDYDIVAQKNLF